MEAASSTNGMNGIPSSEPHESSRRFSAAGGWRASSAAADGGAKSSRFAAESRFSFESTATQADWVEDYEEIDVVAAAGTRIIGT
eukprot:scaffold313023_cov47-Prasinocladus_malaysianus.AAC.2